MSGYPNEESGISTFKLEVRVSSIDMLLLVPEWIFSIICVEDEIDVDGSSSPRGITAADDSSNE
jgi:hypothetical protein